MFTKDNARSLRWFEHEAAWANKVAIKYLSEDGRGYSEDEVMLCTVAS